MTQHTARLPGRRSLALACMVLAPAVFAQNRAETPAPVTTLSQKDVDEMIVTGSRIARPELTAMSPFAVIGEDTIALSNKTNIENFLRNSPQFAQAVGSSTNNGNDGSATVDLRNLGEERTLVLVNGKRFVPYDYQGYVDLSMIPVSLIERVEVITGGASAVYGADAVAGVVNFILKNNFEGLEIDGSYGVTDEGDGDTYDFSVTAGGSFDGGRGNIVFNLGYTKQDPISQGDRSYSFEALGSSDLSPSGSFTTPGGTVLYGSFFGDAEEGCIQFEATGDPTSCASTFNFNPYNLYQVPQEKWTSTFLGTYEINEDVEFFARGSFANNRVDTIIAPTGTFFFPFQLNVAAVTDPTDPGNPFLTPAARSYFQNIDANECDLPQVDADGNFTGPCLSYSSTRNDGYVDFSLGRRLTELGTRNSEYENTAYQFVGGLRGTILDGQDWEIFGQYGRTSRNQAFLNDISADRVQQALLAIDDGSGNTVCSDDSGGCVPANFFGEGNLSVAAGNFIRLNLNEVNKTDQMVFGGALSGDLPFEVPTAANPLSYAAGLEYRREKGKNQPDDNYATGNSVGFGSSSPVDSEIEIQEIFAELLVPVLADAPFAKSVNIETGFRYAQYQNDVNTAAGSFDNTFYNTSWKLGADWSPIDELRFSLMFQRAVRAPTLREIGLPKTPSTGDLSNDPCDNKGPPSDPALIALCAATGVPAGLTGTFTSIVAGQINNYLGGNPDLEPEEADTVTAGVRWEPAFLDDLVIGVDYYDIDIDDAIVELTEQDIVNACYFVEKDASGAFCQLISRNPLTGGLVGGTETGVFRSLANVASETAQGVDLTVRYALDTGSMGTVDFGFDANYVIERKTKPATFLDEYDCTGLVGNTCLRPNPEWVFVQTTRWTYGPATVQLQWRFIDSIKQDCLELNPFDPVTNDTGCAPASVAAGFPNATYPDAEPTGYAVPDIASQSFFDLTGSYELDENWTLRAGITNLFDRDPPIVGNDYGGTTENSGNTYPATYPSIGRGYYVGATAKF